MESQNGIFKVLLVLAITHFSAQAEAHEYQFLKLLKVGQCVSIDDSKPLKEVQLVRKELCDRGVIAWWEITQIGTDFFVTSGKTSDKKSTIYEVHTAQSIGSILWER